GRLITHIGRMGENGVGPVLGFDPFRHLEEFFFGPAGDGHLGPFGREKEGCCGPDAAAATRDKGHFILQTHFQSLCFVRPFFSSEYCTSNPAPYCNTDKSAREKERRGPLFFEEGLKERNPLRRIQWESLPPPTAISS